MSALSGLRVVDVSLHFPAAMAAMHLGDMGADVVSVAAVGDDRDRVQPGFLAWDRNKTRLPLDLHRREHRAELQELLADADVAIFDAPLEELEELRLDAPALERALPQLVHAWAPPYGTGGKQPSAAPAHGLLTALTGIADNQASYSGGPVHLIGNQAYYGQANCLATAVCGALFERCDSGRGQAVVVSGLHGAAQVLATTRFGEPGATNMMSAPLGGAPNYRLYECGDGEWLFLGALFEALYLSTLEVTGVLVDLLGAPGIDGDLGAALVPPGSSVTTAVLERAFRSEARDVWLERLHAADIPSAPVWTCEAWFHGETTAANDMCVELRHERLGTVSMPGVSLQMNGTPARRPALATSVEVTRPWSGDRISLPVPSRSANDDAPLSGVKVLDLGVVIAGAYAGSILAGLGADVVKIETPSGDPFRSYGPTFSSYNRGKRSLVLDLKKTDERNIFLELVAKADVVLDNYRLGVRERLGITYDDLRAVNPRLISLSITGYGNDGPQAVQPGLDPLLQAQSGFMRAQGGPDDEPVFGFIAANDVGSAAMSAFGIVTALVARERTGQGQEVRTSLAAQSVLLQTGELTAHPGAPLPIGGGRDCVGLSATERFYPCADGWIAVACNAVEQVARMLAALGLAEADPGAVFASGRDSDFATRLEQTFASFTVHDAVHLLERAAVPVASVVTSRETVADPYLQDNDFYEPYVDPVFGPGVAVRCFGKFSRSRSGYTRPAPMVGEHTAEVLLEFGVAPERIREPSTTQEGEAP